MKGVTYAPWTPEQVKALNDYQTKSGLHPFTCGNDRMDAAHRAKQAEHGGDFGQLVATADGWKCRACDYTQDWAHNMMTRPWVPLADSVNTLNATLNRATPDGHHDRS